MIDSDNEEYVKVIEDFSYSHEGRNHRIYRHDIYLVLEKRQDWWRVVCSRRKVIWAPKSYLVPTNPTLQQQKDALRAKFQGSRREHNTAHAAAPHTDEAPMGLSSAAHVKNDKGNASAKHTLMGPQEDTPRRDFVPQNHLPTKEELTISHQNLVEQQHQLALSKEEPFLLSRKMSKKKDQKLSKKDISHPTLNSYNQPHFEIKDSHAASKKIQKITKDDISRPIFCSYNYNSSQTLPSPPVASTFKPFSDAMLNSDHNKNPLNAAKPFLGAGSSNRSSRLSLYDGSCSSDSLEDILEENSVASGLKNNPYNSLDAEKNVKHPINGRKASSDERLDSPSRSTDQRHLFSQLSPRNRSNSVDLKSLSKDRVFNDPNDNVVKSSKAGENERNGWRRSLALEEYRAPSNRNAPVQDDFDASHWLDPPPSLPPKKNRSTISLKDSRPGKVIQSNAETSPSSVKRLINDNFEPPKHDEVSRENSQSSEPQQLLSSRRGHKLLQHRTQFESKGKIELNKPYACFDCKDATCLGECCHVRDQQRTTSQALKNHTKNDLPSSIALNRMTRSYTCVGNFPSTESNFDNNVRASKRSEQTHNPNGSALKRNDETKRSFKESATGNVRKNSFLGLFQRGSSKNDPKRRETSSALGLDGGGKKLPQCPPSPDANHEVKRKLDDNWLEYWYPEYKCSFYYNEVTKEKKWKPPRRRLQKQVPVDELELQDRLAWSGLSAADSAPTHLTPEYSTQRSMTPSSRTSSVGSLSENSSQLALQLQPPSIDSHCSSIASSGPGINLTYGSHFATPTETEGSYGSSPDVTPCNCPSCVSRTHYSDRTIGSTCPHVDTGEARSYNASGPADHFNDHSLSNDGPVLPPRPPNGAKPQFSTSSDGFSTPTEPMMLLSGVDDCETGSALREALQTYTPPEGWRKRTCSSRYIFVNMANGDKWEATSTDDGKIYFFNIETGDSNWELPEASARRLSMGGSGNTSDADEALLQSSPGTPTASPINKIVKQGFLMRTLYSREHKKVRKNWSSMLAMLMARVIDGFPSSGGSQLVSPPGPDSPPRSARYFFTFCKSAEDKKVRDEFELLEPVRVVVGAAKNKSSRSNILSLTNAAGTELLLRHDELSVIEDWLSVLRGLDIQLVYPSPPASPKKQHHKSGDKDKGMSDVSPVTTTTESLNNDQRTIRNKLLGFIKRRPTADALAKKGIIRDSVFGNTIAELCKQEKTKSPLFVLQCINAIEKKESNLKTDGLYRISGNAASIQKIRYEVEKNNYEVLFEEKEVNNLTGALKLFFRELKEPLLPYNCYERFIEWSEKSQRSGRHAGDLFEIVKLLPTENFETLKVLLRHLRRVCDYSADNRMNFMNMAIVFGPCLMWPKMTTGRDLMTDAVVQNMVVEGLLMHFE